MVLGPALRDGLSRGGGRGRGTRWDVRTVRREHRSASGLRVAIGSQLRDGATERGGRDEHPPRRPHLAELLFVRESARRSLVERNVALRASKIAAFALGAAVIVPLTNAFDYTAFILPALVVATANVLGFLDICVRAVESTTVRS